MNSLSFWLAIPLSISSASIFFCALIYATHVHGGQVRKGTSTPYIAHLLAVAATVLEYGGDEDLAIAALLHDSVEDQGGTARLEDVRNRFGERVARVVKACSDSLADTAKGERKAHWQERKEAYLAHLRTADDDVLRDPSQTKFTMHARSFVTCENRILAKASGRDSASPRSGHSGTIAASRISSAKDGPGSWLMSCSKSSRCWTKVRTRGEFPMRAYCDHLVKVAGRNSQEG
jgi:HD domain